MPARPQYLVLKWKQRPFRADSWSHTGPPATTAQPCWGRGGYELCHPSPPPTTREAQSLLPKSAPSRTGLRVGIWGDWQGTEPGQKLSWSSQ